MRLIECSGARGGEGGPEDRCAEREPVCARSSLYFCRVQYSAQLYRVKRVQQISGPGASARRSSAT